VTQAFQIASHQEKTMPQSAATKAIKPAWPFQYNCPVDPPPDHEQALLSFYRILEFPETDREQKTGLLIAVLLEGIEAEHRKEASKARALAEAIIDQDKTREFFLQRVRRGLTIVSPKSHSARKGGE
jgi:hypothetical protein